MAILAAYSCIVLMERGVFTFFCLHCGWPTVRRSDWMTGRRGVVGAAAVW